MKFKDMKYERISVEEIAKEEKEIIQAFKEAKSFAEADQIFLKQNALDGHVNSMQVLASTRHSINTEDPFYDAEESYWNQASPQINEYYQEFTKALLASPFRAELEKKDCLHECGDCAEDVFTCHYPDAAKGK